MAEASAIPGLDRLALVAVLLGGLHMSTTSEAALQAEVERRIPDAVPQAKIGGELVNDRVDLLWGDVAIELKTTGSNASIIRQLQRYLLHDEISAVVLVTTVHRHVGIPRELAGKLIMVLYVGGPF